MSFPHRRKNPLSGQWIIVSPHRLSRPWKGQTEAADEPFIPSFDPANPLCPGSLRPNGERNPDYHSTFCFTNDFAALLPDCETPPADPHPLFQTAPAQGTCKVMCFHPRSDLQLATMTETDILTVINAWIVEFNKLAPAYDWVQIFENKGAVMGCSNPHPHCQIWACKFLPQDPYQKNLNQKQYYETYGRPMLMDYVQQELRRQERIVLKTEFWVVLVPYWAFWPYETMVLPQRAILRLSDCTEAEKLDLAHITKQLLVKYDNLFKCSFPYSMGWQGAPTGSFLSEDCSHWTLHAMYFPPLLRSATVKKFLAGFEMVCEPQRDLTPEKAAETLREVSGIHYKTAVA